MVAAAIGAAASAAMAANSIANSSSGGGSSSGGSYNGSGSPGVYIPASQSYADQAALTAMNSLAGSASTLYGQMNGQMSSLLPQLQQYTSAIEGNPYAASAQDFSNKAASWLQGTVAPLADRGANVSRWLGENASTEAQAVQPYIQQALQAGFDPQSSLYNQQYQQMLDQSNAINAMSGVAQSPYGAQLSTQNAQNFNNQWLNQQLGRQQTAAATSGALASEYGGLANTANTSFNNAVNLSTQSAEALQNAGQLPYQTYLGQQTDALNALGAQISGGNQLASGVTQSMTPTQQAISDYLGYLGIGQTASQIGASIGGQNFQQNQAMGQNLATSLAGLGGNLGTLWNNSFGQDAQGQQPLGLGWANSGSVPWTDPSQATPNQPVDYSQNAFNLSWNQAGG